MPKHDGVIQLLKSELPLLPTETTIGEYDYNPMLERFVDPDMKYGFDLNQLHPGDHQLDFDRAQASHPTLRSLVYGAGRKLAARVKSHRVRHLVHTQVRRFRNKLLII